MSDPTSHQETPDFTYIEDSAVRRALRAMQQHVTETLNRQQMEIDALLELMVEKHVTSLSEFKRHLIRLQQDVARSNRLHGAMTVTPPPSGMTH